MDASIECRCDECGTRFDEDLLVKQHYAEYPGASMQPMFVSPCCHVDWDYVYMEGYDERNEIELVTAELARKRGLTE